MMLGSGGAKRHKVRSLYNKCRGSDSNMLTVVLRAAYYKVFYHITLLVHQKVIITEPKNIHCNGVLEIGVEPVAFMHPLDKTLINVKGKLHIQGNYSIGRGCRLDIGKDAIVTIGNGGYINANTKLIISHNLTIGDNCFISWDCQFLDNDFHTVHYEGKIIRDASIRVGDNVWIGCGAKIYKGTVIPNGCVIASDSVVRGIFLKENCVIGGNPARVIKESVNWI